MNEKNLFSLKEISLEKDVPFSFYCRDKKIFINIHYVCNGNDDCLSSDDENFCIDSVESLFHCLDNRTSISHKNVCDFILDCPDGSDEQFCCKK